jgi:hypothetical protein
MISRPRLSSAVPGSIVAALAALLLSACSPSEPPVAAPTTPACPATEPEADEAGVVSAARLCAIDGRDWQIATFVTIMEAPAWDERSAACDDIRPDVWWGAWSQARENMVTIDVEIDDGDASTTYDVIPVGVAVVVDPEPAAAIDLIESEVDACLTDTTRSARIDAGDWQGVSAPSSIEGDAIDRTWWVAGEDRWALVQVPVLDDASPERVAAFDVAVETVLHAQLDLLRSP